MMLCPVCGRSYEAGTLFCMDDGTPLAPTGPSPSASGELGRLLGEQPASSAPPPAVAAPVRSGGLLAIVGVLGVLVVGTLAAVMWQQKQTSDAAAARAEQAEQRADEAQQAANVATAAADVQARDAAEQVQTAYRDTGDGTTAWANSPNDGFVALRSGPSVSSGTRLLQIPHGQPLALSDCDPPTALPGGRTGSWCRAAYGGTAGWAFVTR